MTTRDDRPGDAGGPTPPARRRRGQRRALAVAGVAGLAAVLGGAAYVTTSAIVSRGSATTTDGAAPIIPATSPPSTPKDVEPVAPATTTQEARKAKPSPTIPTTDVTGKPLSEEVRQRIKEARRKMAEDGVEVQHPVTPKAVRPLGEVQTTTEGSFAEGGMIRILSARGDLTGQRELSGVAGGIEKYGNVSCSQTFKFATSPRPAKKPNLLMCWRATPDKSVAAIVVDPKGNPSRERAVAAIQKKWKTMD
ncbi:hypothetical protein GCM10010112_18580 [Actinoplanes lobatus]|uniref:Uncharacterized protein n=1 Tax=Actinoplanes lobatus TaxID=113568 RepID=A0A7W7H970_9ACTN|nr:hypothetical protein [Actinoplanes lobatus]MBB4746183.1 hypothetical protein [Actinoplanes lobatus]GGN61425.1 hypothetical protein GCM10010112_18580 [Actinoplanes lobatus]GIE41391.1 hypothetical protein Alo02nite_42890 [Actinoplanes lobatus]